MTNPAEAAEALKARLSSIVQKIQSAIDQATPTKQVFRGPCDAEAALAEAAAILVQACEELVAEYQELLADALGVKMAADEALQTCLMNNGMNNGM